MAQIRYWVWLTTLEGLRSISVTRLLETFGGPMEAYFAPNGGYDAVPDLTEREKELLMRKDMERTEFILEKCQQEGIRLITIQDAEYPERLRQIPDPPCVLYVRGRLPYLDELPVIGLVGTRKASPYGIKMATRIAQEITAGGGCVITGMAIGVDGAAARGALLENGPCIGVLGTAIDVNYPASNASLIDDVAAVGAIVSEFPPGYPTKPENFPRRNRIISGLSCGVCIVEAPRRSGALITADLALEQGRDLFVVPGNADSPNSAGSNALLRDCARAVTTGTDILSEYEGLYPNAVQPVKEIFTPQEKPAEPPEAAKTEIDNPPAIPYIDVESRLSAYTEDQQAMLRCLLDGEAHIDEIISSTGFTPSKVLAGMTLLVIRGAVRSHPGKRFSLNLKQL